MYLGIDFLITPHLKPVVVEVNVGLPGGAQEYDLAHRVYLGKPSTIFTLIEETSARVYGKSFKDYLYSLPWIQSLKTFKLWMDGNGPFPLAKAEGALTKGSLPKGAPSASALGRPPPERQVGV